MMRWNAMQFLSGCALCVALCVSLTASADDVFNMSPGLTSVELVEIGNPGNALYANTFYGESYGDVDYVYHMSKFEITSGQYCEFLNAVAADDTYGLYNIYMENENNVGTVEWQKSNIQRQGSPGSYSYSVVPGFENRPVNNLFFTETLRFCNWLQNGQPTGAQDATTTEDGAYRLEGTSYSDFVGGVDPETVLSSLPRNPNAQYVLPTLSELIKAGFHKNDGVTGNYYTYPTSSDSMPINRSPIMNPDPGNSVTWSEGLGGVGGFWTTEVGEHENSASPYGVYDIAGNGPEWYDNTGITVDGEWEGRIHGMDADYDYPEAMTIEGIYGNGVTPLEATYGFRIARIDRVSEPLLLMCEGLTTSTDLSEWDLQDDGQGKVSLIADPGSGASGDEAVFEMVSFQGNAVSLKTPPVDPTWEMIYVSFEYQLTSDTQAMLEIVVGDQVESFELYESMGTFAPYSFEVSDVIGSPQVEFRLTGDANSTLLLDCIDLQGSGYVPEPATMGLLAFGGLATVIRRRK
jgi:hypothetical protein